MLCWVHGLRGALAPVCPAAAARCPFLPETLSRPTVLTCRCASGLPEVTETAPGKGSGRQCWHLAQARERLLLPAVGKDVVIGALGRKLRERH